MAEPMSPSKTISRDQIGKIQDLLGDKLRKNGPSFEAVQIVIETQGAELAHELWQVMQKRIDAVVTTISRDVRVNRSLTPQQILDATGRQQFVNASSLGYVPRRQGAEKKVFFFKLARKAAFQSVFLEYGHRGLVPDPYAQAQVNIDDPNFADQHPNASVWHANGAWLFVSFNVINHEPSVCLNYGDGNGTFLPEMWFAGVPK